MIDGGFYELTFAVVLDTGTCVLQCQVGGICKHSLHALKRIRTGGVKKICGIISYLL